MLRPWLLTTNEQFIILHQRSKSNHNELPPSVEYCGLFYIKDRNQTTTSYQFLWSAPALFYIKDRNQTTTGCSPTSIPTDYFTSKIEIKPQRKNFAKPESMHYFTSKIEIKPQLSDRMYKNNINYFTSKIEIKPQPFPPAQVLSAIILHQRSKSNHN